MLLSPRPIARKALAVSALSLLAGLTACTPPQPTAVAGENQLPGRIDYLGSGVRESWLTLSESDWRMKAIDPQTRERLMSVRDRMAKQRTTTGYAYWGKYSPDLEGEMVSVQRDCDTALLTSEEMVNRYPTPELYALSSTFYDKRRSDAVNYNLDFRNLADDWARVWLADEPIQTAPTAPIDVVP